MVIDEAQLSNEFLVCDNVDLETIYLEFSSYFQVKFGKKPRFVKKADHPNVSLTSLTSSLISTDSRLSSTKRRSILKINPNVTTILQPKAINDITSSDCLRISSFSPPTHDDNNDKMCFLFPKPMSNDDFFNNHPSDWKEMTEMIFKDVVKKDLCVKWDDVMGQDDAKMIIQESVIFPMKYPQLYNRVQPWKGSKHSHNLSISARN